MKEELDDIQFMLNKQSPNIKSIKLMLEVLRIVHKI